METMQTPTPTITPSTTPSTTHSNGDHDLFAHYVTPPEAVTESIVTGTPVRAVCGKVWVPSRNPDGFDLCPVCEEIYNLAPDEVGE